MSSLRKSAAYQQAEMEATLKGNRYLDEPGEGMRLLARLITTSRTGADPELQPLLDSLRKLIYERFMEVAGRDNYPREAEQFRILDDLYESLEDLTEFPDLASKQVVGIGGSFSAGKSCFINALIGQSLLPVGLKPTTAIPTIITRAKESDGIRALNTSNARIDLDVDALDAISHSFHERYQVGFSHLLRYIMIESATFPYTNTILLDTPGYSKSDAPARGGTTDEAIALGHLKKVDRLIWVISSEKGTFQNSDLKFLDSLELRLPIFVVINKADLRLPDIDDIMAVTREAAAKAGLVLDGMAAFNAHAPAGQQVIRGDSVKQYLLDLDREPKKVSRRQGFARVFDTYLAYNRDELNRNRVTLQMLNSIYLDTSANVSKADRRTLKGLIEDTRKDQKRLTGVVRDFESLKTEVLDVVNQIVGSVDLEEVSEIPRAAALIPVEVHEEGEIPGIGDTVPVTVRYVTPFGIFLEAHRLGWFRLSLETVRQDLQLDPKSLNIGQELQGEFRDVVVNPDRQTTVHLAVTL